jgi:hypothetical protein
MTNYGSTGPRSSIPGHFVRRPRSQIGVRSNRWLRARPTSPCRRTMRSSLFLANTVSLQLMASQPCQEAPTSSILSRSETARTSWEAGRSPSQGGGARQCWCCWRRHLAADCPRIPEAHPAERRRALAGAQAARERKGCCRSRLSARSTRTFGAATSWAAATASTFRTTFRLVWTPSELAAAGALPRHEMRRRWRSLASRHSRRSRTAHRPSPTSSIVFASWDREIESRARRVHSTTTARRWKEASLRASTDGAFSLRTPPKARAAMPLLLHASRD